MEKLTSCVSILAAIFSASMVRADPTFTFGPVSNYQKIPVLQPTPPPVGSNIYIGPMELGAGVPSGGIDFFLGPDLQDTLANTLQVDCANGLSAECTAALYEIFRTDQAYDIESRVVGIDDLLGLALWGGAVVVGIAAHLMSAESPSVKVSAIHLEATDISQLQSQTGSSIVIETSTGASAPITVFITPTPTPTLSATFTTLTADANGHHSGDVIIALPTEFARPLGELIGIAGGIQRCGNVSSSSKRQSGGVPNYDAITDISLWVLPMMAPGRILETFGLEAAAQVPRLQAAVDQASLAAVTSAALALEFLQGLDSGMVTCLAEVLWIGVFDYCVNESPDLTELVVEKYRIQEQDPKCPDNEQDFPACSDSTCTGINGVCSTGAQQCCECLLTMTQYWQPGTQDTWTDAQILLADMLEPDGVTTVVAGGNLTCGSRSDMGNPNFYVDLDTINDAANLFCQQLVDNATIFVASRTPDARAHKAMHFNNHTYNPVFLSLDWDDDPSCPSMYFSAPGGLATCQDILGTIINDCDTANPTGWTYWKQGGTFTRDCMTWAIARDTFACPYPTADDSWRPPTHTCSVDGDCQDILRCEQSLGVGYCVRPEDSQGWCSCATWLTPC